MVTRLQPLNLEVFTGGLNLRADAFQLQENESPEMLNVDVDPVGGVRSRRSWGEWNGTAVGAATWAPTRLHVFEQASGDRDVLLVNDGDVYTAPSSGAFTQLSDDVPGTVPASADVHGADFSDWGDEVFIACGKTEQARKWTGTGDATVLTASGPTYQDDYTAPTGGYFPACDFVTTYQGYMVAASTIEDGVTYPNRVRLSHPNSAEDWSSTDYLDIEAGGARITGIAAFSDHIVVFKTNSVWAIYGYDADSFVPVNITMALGAIHRNAIAVASNAVFFYGHPDGVHTYEPGNGVFEISTQLRPIIDSGELNAAALDNVFVGYLNRRVWVSVPYEQDAVASDARSTFVLDPALGAWTLYTDANGDALGPFATGGVQGDGALMLAAHRVNQRVMEVENGEDALDTLNQVRSEERRVGKECRYGGSPDH